MFEPTPNNRAARLPNLIVFICIFLFNVHSIVAQPPPAEPQSNTWQALTGSPFLTDIKAIISRSNVDNATAQAAQIAASFERSNWATGSVFTDPFYKLPDNASQAAPGDVLKVEQITNASLYTMPPNVALSRFEYQTEDLNGTSIPASAFVLWPWSARKFPNITGIPIIAWAHGTSGSPTECAPSHVQNLWYQFNAPFTLALMGYAVIAPDYAGLGIPTTATGAPIPHQWGAAPAAANDLIYAVSAAKKAWPSRLSAEFVVFGHSQGGGAAWAAAERQARDPAPGYLGAIAASPLRDISVYGAAPLSIVGSAIALGAATVGSVFPDFRIGDWFTDEGERYYDLYRQVQGCQSVVAEIFNNPEVAYARPGWNESYYLGVLAKLTKIGEKAFKGPLLVLQGTKDQFVDTAITTELVNATCATFAANEALTYAKFEGSDHVPTLYASQQYWLRWIEDRFGGVAEDCGCKNEDFASELPVEDYQAQVRYFLESPEYAYETA